MLFGAASVVSFLRTSSAEDYAVRIAQVTAQALEREALEKPGANLDMVKQIFKEHFWGQAAYTGLVLTLLGATVWLAQAHEGLALVVALCLPLLAVSVMLASRKWSALP